MNSQLPAELFDTRAASAVRILPGSPAICDMYDPRGAEIYHDFTVGDTSEVLDILRRVHGTSGRILELAAGAGRLTIPLLGLHREVVAVDLSAAMLDLLRTRLARLPRSASRRCEVVHGDITAYAPGQPVGVAVLGTTSVSLLTPEQRRTLLRRTWVNLAPGGSFVLTTAQLSPSAELGERALVVRGASGVDYRVYDVIAADGSGRHTVVIAPGPDGNQTVCHSHIRVVPRAELAGDLVAAGFVVKSMTTLPGERYTTTLIHAVKGA